MTDLVSIPRGTAEHFVNNAALLLMNEGRIEMHDALRAVLDGPPEYVSIPIADARAIAAWRRQGGSCSEPRISADIGVKAGKAIDRLVASLPPEHPPWEPTEEQITAFCHRCPWLLPRGDVRLSLIAAHAVFEGDPT